MRAIHLSIAVAVLVAAGLPLSAGAPEKNAPAGAITPDAIWTQPLFGTGIKTNDAYTDGNFFFTYPLWSTIGKDGKLGGDYLFVEPYSSVGSGGEVAASLGLSWRHLFSDESVNGLQKKGSAKFMEEGWFVGSSLFVDMLDTQHRNSFWQLGVGAEVGNRYLELRGNYYIPLTSQKLAERNVSEQSFSSSSVKYNTVGSGVGDPSGSGSVAAASVCAEVGPMPLTAATAAANGPAFASPARSMSAPAETPAPDCRAVCPILSHGPRSTGVGVRRLHATAR